MPPTIKDSDTATVTRDAARSGSEAASTNDAAVKPQPVALEVPITVNGARAVEGSDKREPFSESTKTVMVHGAGAVIRLNSAMAPGQLLFLTNERTKKEVVCQVVKSKNYRNVSGYVELEFTEPAVGFWGMRFPGDRIGPGPQAAPAATRPSAVGSGSPAPERPAEEKPAPAAGSGALSGVTAKPPIPAPVSAKPATPAARSIVPPPIDSMTLLGGAKSKSPSSAPPASPAPVSTTLDSDAPLVEPWLKKREPAVRIPAPAPPRAAAPERPAKIEAPEKIAPPSRNFEMARPSDQAASLFAPSEAAASLGNVDLSSLAPFFDVKPAAAEVPPAPQEPPAASVDDGETEELKQRTARLQEELSKMQFAEPLAVPPLPVKPAEEKPAAPVVELPVAEPKMEPVHESAVKLVENSGTLNAHPLLGELPPIDEPAEEVSKEVLPAPIPALDSLEQEQMKIPAWLEPLARNASAPTSTKELVQREKTKRVAEQPALKEMMAPLAAPMEKGRVADSRVPQFGSALPFEEKKSAREAPRKKSGKGMAFAAVAAGVALLVGGGWWYMKQSAGSRGGIASTGSIAGPADLQTSAIKESVLGTTPSGHNDSGVVASQSKRAAADSNASVNSAASAPVNATAPVARNGQTNSNSANAASAATSGLPAQAEPDPAAEKKPALGEVHLEAPKISQKRTAQSGAEPDPGISLSEDQPEANTDSLGAGLAVSGSQPAAPAAPVPVGGEVKQAKLISEMPPVYPQLARSQHVSGGVTIDALIDANGRVTTMKVISGPTLLQQAAKDALKQWKYQPATLDGKPVSMHLTVTVQFRLD